MMRRARVAVRKSGVCSRSRTRASAAGNANGTTSCTVVTLGTPVRKSVPLEGFQTIEASAGTRPVTALRSTPNAAAMRARGAFQPGATNVHATLGIPSSTRSTLRV